MKCGHWSDRGGECGATEGVHQYMPGPRCPNHHPAALAGRTVPVPDPQRTAAALRKRART